MKGYILFFKHVRKVIGKLINCYYIVLSLIIFIINILNLVIN